MVSASVPAMEVCEPAQILLGFGLCMGEGRNIGAESHYKATLAPLRKQWVKTTHTPLLEAVLLLLLLCIFTFK